MVGSLRTDRSGGSRSKIPAAGRTACGTLLRMFLQVPCPQCGRVPPPDCDCPPLPPGPPDPPEEVSAPKARREPVKLRREKRRGRPVIVISGLPDDVDRAEYSKALKQRCASGGTVKGGDIEIQGEHRESIEAFLRERGFKTKRSGG